MAHPTSSPSAPAPAAPPALLRIVYEHCGETWEDIWDCACNDRCPVCNREIEPLSFAALPPEAD